MHPYQGGHVGGRLDKEPPLPPPKKTKNSGINFGPDGAQSHAYAEMKPLPDLDQFLKVGRDPRHNHVKILMTFSQEVWGSGSQVYLFFIVLCCYLCNTWLLSVCVL